jgi:MoaA/NifB/PqqE/SkfB family radical SAM enzyme
MPHTTATRRLKVRRDRVGVHAFDRVTGLNVLFDDIAVPEGEWAAAPRHLAIALTNACDLRCSYCYAPKHRAVLDPERVLGWMREADSAGCLSVGFGGGEPTTLVWFAELCRDVATRTALAVSFTTHGHRLNDELLDALAGSVHMVRVSVDGVGRTYERLRGRSYTALLERLAALAHVAPFGINVVVNDDTIEDLDALAELASSAGARELLLLPEQRVGAGAGVSPEAVQRLHVWVRAYTGEVPLAVSEQGGDGLPVADPFADQPAIEQYAHVDASGVLRPTSFAVRGVGIGARGLLTAYRQLLQEEMQ